MANSYQRFMIELNIKPSTVKVNMSCTFPVRTKCRFCLRGPEHYLMERLPIKWFNPKHSKNIAAHAGKHIKRMVDDFYLAASPKFFTGIRPFSFDIPALKYNPCLHTKRGVMVMGDVDTLSCECGRSAWYFSDKANILRDDIIHRKARYKYPRKFDDWF